MVTANRSENGKSQGALVIEIIMAISILTVASLPVAFSILHEQRLARAYYFRAIAIEIVDGEMELLRAGQWRAFPQGSHPYPIRLEAATNLPAGRFILTLRGDWARLDWVPDGKRNGGAVFREAQLK